MNSYYIKLFGPDHLAIEVFYFCFWPCAAMKNFLKLKGTVNQETGKPLP